MLDYKHILVAFDFSDHSEEITNRAVDLSQKYQSLLSIVHVVEYVPFGDSPYGPIISYDFNLKQELVGAARKQLAKVGEKVSVPEKNQWLEVGSPKLEIVRIAGQNAVDLIVLGSHGRHGLALLLGSTANGVLHHTKCDVLAVRLKGE